MTVLLGEAAADFFTEGGLIPGKGHGTQNAFETDEWMIGGRSTALEHVVAVLAFHNNGITAIGGLSRALRKLRWNSVSVIFMPIMIA